MALPAGLKPRGGKEQALPRYSQSPLLVFYEVTQACDLVCNHCRACAQTMPRPDELSAEESRRLITQIAAFPSPPMLVLTGGDPFKRVDIFDLVEYSVELGLDVSVTPSATPLVSRWTIRRLAEAGISRLAVSLDGADAATHDALRGVTGSFSRTLQILIDSRAAGVPAQVNTTITPANVGQIDHLSQLLGQYGIVMWSVFFLVPVGRARNATRLSAEQYEVAFEQLWQQSRRQRFAIKATEAPHYRRFVSQRRLFEPRSCRSRFKSLYVNDGKGVMFISHSGEIYPSGFMPILCGRFPNDHVVQTYQTSALFRGLRDPSRLEGKCRVCEYRQMCGGSRARAYAVTGNPYAEEPDCSYIPNRDQK